MMTAFVSIVLASGLTMIGTLLVSVRAHRRRQRWIEEGRRISAAYDLLSEFRANRPDPMVARSCDLKEHERKILREELEFWFAWHDRVDEASAELRGRMP